MPFYENNLLILMSHALQAAIEQPNYAAFREYEILNLAIKWKIILFLVDTILEKFGQYAT